MCTERLITPSFIKTITRFIRYMWLDDYTQDYTQEGKKFIFINCGVSEFKTQYSIV